MSNRKRLLGKDEWVGISRRDLQGSSPFTLARWREAKKKTKGRKARVPSLDLR